jgi:hypothetical protein
MRVVTQFEIGTEAQISRLRRLGVVFANELRLKIVTELYMQEMSPTQFFKAFGGGSASRVHRNFKTLAEYQWLRFLWSESGGRRGGPQHFYRATELAVFDDDTWGLLPYSIRAALSETIFRQFCERVREAMEAGTFDARPDRHFTWTPLLLDHTGQARVITAVDDLFKSLAEEQADAKLRIFNSGETPFLATAGLGAFESPSRPQGSGGEPVGPSLAEGTPSPVPVLRRLSKVFDDPVCLKIVAETNLRPMSAPQFYGEFGGNSVEDIRRRFKMLESIGWERLIDQKTGGRRRGAVEHFYRATGPAIFDNSTWSHVPDSRKAAYSWRIFRDLAEQVRVAMKFGTFDACLNRHFTWSLLRLDRLGWGKVIKNADELFTFLFKEQADAERRMERSGDKPVTMTVSLAVFESPRSLAKIEPDQV